MPASSPLHREAHRGPPLSRPKRARTPPPSSHESADQEPQRPSHQIHHAELLAPAVCEGAPAPVNRFVVIHHADLENASSGPYFGPCRPLSTSARALRSASRYRSGHRAGGVTGERFGPTGTQDPIRYAHDFGCASTLLTVVAWRTSTNEPAPPSLWARPWGFRLQYGEGRRMRAWLSRTANALLDWAHRFAIGTENFLLHRLFRCARWRPWWPRCRPGCTFACFKQSQRQGKPGPQEPQPFGPNGIGANSPATGQPRPEAGLPADDETLNSWAPQRGSRTP